MPRFNLSSDLQSQLDCGGHHPIDNQFADRLVDGHAGNRLAARLAARAVRAVADVPSLQSTAPCSISNPQMPAAVATYGSPLQQSRPFSRRGGSCDFVSPAIGLKRLEILLKLLPGDIAGVGVRDAGEPVTALACSKQLLPADSPPMPPAKDIGLQADAYAGYNGLYDPMRSQGAIRSALCWAHARRKVFELADITANARRGKATPAIPPIALEAVKRIDALFDTSER
jgi:hypothetical protein